MTPEEIVRVFQSGTAAAPAGTDKPGDLSEDEKARRVAQLAPILDAVSALRGEGAGQLDLLAQKIGDASRDGESSLAVRDLLFVLTSRLARAMESAPGRSRPA